MLTCIKHYCSEITFELTCTGFHSILDAVTILGFSKIYQEPEEAFQDITVKKTARAPIHSKIQIEYWKVQMNIEMFKHWTENLVREIKD